MPWIEYHTVRLKGCFPRSSIFQGSSCFPDMRRKQYEIPELLRPSDSDLLWRVSSFTRDPCFPSLVVLGIMNFHVGTPVSVGQ